MTIDEHKLDRLQSTARLLAIGVLLVFVALIGYSGYRLRGIQKQIEASTATLDEQRIKLRKQEEALAEGRRRKAELEGEIAEVEQRLAAMRELSSRIAQENPALVRRAAEEAIVANPATAASLPRVFPQIRREAQRAGAREIARKLETAGFLVPGIENVGDKSPRRSQVRYFRQNEEGRKDVRELVDLLRQAGVTAEATFVEGYEESIQARRQYEIWFGDDFSP